MSTQRELKTIKLSNCEVDIITFLTWGEKEKIQAFLMGGVNFDASGPKNLDGEKYVESKYKLLETCIKEIRMGEEKKQFTKEWMENLSIEDGDLLYDEVDKLGKKK